MRITLDGDSFELTPELVRTHIGGRIPETIRDYWVQIDGRRWPVKQVISLAPVSPIAGASNRNRLGAGSATWVSRSAGAAALFLGRLRQPRPGIG